MSSKLIVNEWALEALKDRGISVENGKIVVEFYKGKRQEVKDLPAAIRQQKHIIEQQREEQDENEAIGKLMRQFHNTVAKLNSMEIKAFTKRRKTTTLNKLNRVLEEMSKKREDLRKDGYNRLRRVHKMLQRDNIPAAIWASNAALERMRKRWLVNEKVIDKSHARLEALKNLHVV